MNLVPELSPREIHDELKRIYAKSRKRDVHLHALYGRGIEEKLRVEDTGEFLVVPVRSELELRERMPPLEETDRRLVFLVPWQGSVPLDLVCRFESSRVRALGLDRRLQSLCGVRESEGLGNLALAKYLLRPGNPIKHYPVASGRLTEEALWCAWLATDWKLHFGGGIARDTLLAWVGTDTHGAQFLEALNPEREPSARGVREEWLAHLSRALPGLGPVLWRVWEQGRGRELLHVAALCECLASNPDGAVSMWLSERLKPLLVAAEVPLLPELARALGAAAPLAFRVLEGRLAAHELDALFEGADARVDAPIVREALITSDRLPSAWSSRLARLGELLARGAQSPSADGVAEASGALKALETHRAFQEQGQTEAVKRAEMAVRLLAWLAARREIEAGGTDHADVAAVGTWYAQEGGYVDWARRWARGSSNDPLGVGAQAVVERADRERARLDERFTRALKHWVSAGRPSHQVVPLDQALKRFGVSFLEQNRERRLLVLLMDGMAWAQAVELLQSLGTRAYGWGPLAWHGTHRVGDGPYPVVLANLPTTTEVSRSAFFAGKEMPSGSALNTQKDDERFRNNKALHPFCAQALGPRLLLRAEGHNLDGSASNEALEVIRDTRRRIVGVVVNAIDASLKGDTQQAHKWTVDSIRSLAALLDTARDAGRNVLLVADHGHVRADRLRPIGAPALAGARWRPWLGDGDAVQAGELAFAGAGVYTPKGAQGVVLLTTEDLRYGGGAHAGEHGGATLAEVITPCLLLGWDELSSGALVDPALKPRPAYVPDWWHFVVRPAVETPPVTTPPPPPSKKKKAVPEAQLGLPLPSQEPPPPVGSPPGKGRLEGPIAAFAACDMLKARAPQAPEREQVTSAVALLLSRGGALAAEVFAQHMGVLAFRVEGYVRRLQEVLNVDGYPVLRFDSAARQIFLDKAKLEQQFEVKL